LEVGEKREDEKERKNMRGVWGGGRCGDPRYLGLAYGDCKHNFNSFGLCNMLEAA
jgi:hypothetical protein